MAPSRPPPPRRAAHRVVVHEVRREQPLRRREDRLVVEEPLEVRLAWPGRSAERVAVTMRTPGHDFELATGLLHAEGLLAAGSVAEVGYCTDVRLPEDQRFNVVTVTASEPPGRMPRRRPDTVTAGASACGVCGADSIDDVLHLRHAALAAARPASADREVSAAALHLLPARLRKAQRLFDSTGGLHAAGLFDRDGEALVVREDVGRHNAVDKVVGARVLAGQGPAPLLCVSGRVGFEVAQKAVAFGVGVLAAIGAPSSLAVRLAEEAGLAVVGFLREDRFVVYAGRERLGV